MAANQDEGDTERQLLSGEGDPADIGVPATAKKTMANNYVHGESAATAQPRATARKLGQVYPMASGSNSASLALDAEASDMLRLDPTGDREQLDPDAADEAA